MRNLFSHNSKESLSGWGSVNESRSLESENHIEWRQGHRMVDGVLKSHDGTCAHRRERQPVELKGWGWQKVTEMAGCRE